LTAAIVIIPDLKVDGPASDQEAVERLEPCALKGARTVLRGGCARNSVSLPDYKVLFSRTTSPCTELACWAHARCKFFDLHQANNSPLAISAAAYRHLIRNRSER